MTPAAVIVKWVWAPSHAGTLVAQVLQGKGRKPVWKRPELTNRTAGLLHTGTPVSHTPVSFWAEEGSQRYSLKRGSRKPKHGWGGGS